MRTTGKATDLITFSRSSGGTALRKIAYGPELVTNGTFDTDLTGWTEQSGGSVFTVSSGQLTISRSAIDPGYVYQTIDTTVGSIYSLTFDIIDDGPIDLRVGNSPAGLQITSSGIKSSAGTYTLLFVATGATAYISAVNTSYSTDATIDNISVKEVLFDQGDLTLFNHPADIPRIEYDANGNVLGLLVEESRTNLNDDSEIFSGWSKTGTTENNGVVTATSGTGHHRISRAFSVSSAAVSWFDVKAGTHSFITIYDGASTQNFAYFDLSNGTVGSVGSNTTATIRHLGGNVYRCACAYGSTNTPNGNSLLALTSSATGSWGGTFTATGTESIVVLRHQIELGAFPTSYIPTSGSTATRAADVASIATSEFGYRDDEGTLVVEASSYEGSPMVSHLNSGSDANRAQISPIGANITAYVQSTGDSGSFLSVSGAAVAPFKAALGIDTNNMGLSAKGSPVSVDTSQNVPVSVIKLNIGSNAINSVVGQIRIKSIKYIPRRLTNDQLVEITS